MSKRQRRRTRYQRKQKQQVHQVQEGCKKSVFEFYCTQTKPIFTQEQIEQIREGFKRSLEAFEKTYFAALCKAGIDPSGNIYP